MRNLLTVVGLVFILALVWSIISGGMSLIQTIFGLESKTMDAIAGLVVLMIVVSDLRNRSVSSDGLKND